MDASMVKLFIGAAIGVAILTIVGFGLQQIIDHPLIIIVALGAVAGVVYWRRQARRTANRV